MTANIETPAKLASLVLADIRQGAASILDACSRIAAAYDAIGEEGAWSEKQFLDFIDRLAEEKIGPGRSVFVRVDKKGVETFEATARAGVYYQMMSVGRCEAFKTPHFRKIDRIASYSVLYRLVVLFNLHAEKTKENPRPNIDKAYQVVYDLVEQYGVDLTRKIVDAAINKARTQRRSYKPKKSKGEIRHDQTKTGEASLKQLISDEARYDVVLVTPSEQFLEMVEATALGDLVDKAPYQEIRKSKSKAVVVGPGRHLEALKALAENTNASQHVYCIRENPDKNAIIDLSEELVVFTSTPLDVSMKRSRSEDPKEFIQRLITEDQKPQAKMLHLFAEKKTEGWDFCGEREPSVRMAGL
jgi:hypothetical protein